MSNPHNLDPHSGNRYKRARRGRRLGWLVAALIVLSVGAGGLALIIYGSFDIRAQTDQFTELAFLPAELAQRAAPRLARVDASASQAAGQTPDATAPSIGQAVAQAAPTFTPAPTPASSFDGAGSSVSADLLTESRQADAVAPATLYAQADAAYVAGDWTGAIEFYAALQARDAAYERATIQRNLAGAYRGLALAILTAAPAAPATLPTELEAARRALNGALAADPNDAVAAEELELLTSYMTGVRLLQLESPAEAAVILQQLYDARPGYLAGLAAGDLYRAYLTLGDIGVRQGELNGARSFYDRAATITVADAAQLQARLNKLDELIYLTPTPYPQNLATVQAFAAARRLPPVLPATPTPADAAEAAGRAEFATAMALTTGTFTPGPESYVTPMLVLGTPPAENVATEAARVAQSTAQRPSALVPTPQPLPYNAVMAEYTFATPLPENAATAAAQAIISEANALLYGTPTPLPWNAVIITRAPTPLPPTPLPLLVPVTDLTPTPTVAPAINAPSVIPPALRNKVVFISDRGGSPQTYLLDPGTGEVSLITQDWVYPMAREGLAGAPDGRQEAQVLADDKRVLQIQVYSHEYKTTRQVTAVSAKDNPDAIAYDPAWSPVGNVIAYASSETRGDEIYTVNLDSGRISRLTNNSWEWDKHPTWSPDGSQILFYSNRESGRKQLWIMEADGANQRNLSNNEFNDWDPIWIP